MGKIPFDLSKSIIEKEAEFYKIIDVPNTNDIKPEVGGLALTDDDKLGVSIRCSEIWLVD
jgi:hypothetical protein|tara:strand:- start:278 stop:457 length:180 start_codon:yes stop_codon:yes gene_type:complete